MKWRVIVQLEGYHEVVVEADDEAGARIMALSGLGESRPTERMKMTAILANKIDPAIGADLPDVGKQE